ncbi:MAG: hypothetical protein NC821_04705, partial [Candidatus Omnitrophica bacterium]|nr:hypothetical protein [Candidatus Omnitrophota bacterium]
GKLEIKPTLLGKLSTFFQTLTIMFIILHFSLVPLFWYITGLFTLASGLNYLWKGSRCVFQEGNK